MQRVRIGLTGLGFVFLAVLLAAVFTSQRQDEAPITANLIEQQQRSGGEPAPAPPVAEAPSAEPLAELGVAPGNVDSNAAAPPPAATRAPPAAPPPAAR